MSTKTDFSTTPPTPPPFELSYDGQGRVVLKRPGEEDAVDIRIRRAFPWTEPDRYVSLRNSDGKEILLIEDLSSLDPARRQFIGLELSRGSFIPRITKIFDIDTRFGLQKWSVETDRGPVQFRVQEREDIRFLNDGRFRIKDADGNVYEMVKFDDLDVESRRNLEPLI